MSYDKNTWVTGDVITAEKMNHIEEGLKNLSDLVEEMKNEIVNYEDGNEVAY